MNLIYFLDIIGTFAFAVSGALVASDKKYDLFGVIIIAFVAAVGGGMIRDILTQQVPLIFKKEIYALACFISAFVFLT